MQYTYHSDTKTFTLVDLGDGTGTFIKVTSPLPLKEGYIISFGETHMVISYNGNTLCIRFLDGPKIDHEFFFQTHQAPIKIGRGTDCEVRIDDNNLSRYQCNIEYNSRWLLNDGFTKTSTNGTWLFAEEPFVLTNGTIFKAGHTLFECKIIQLNNA